MQLRIPGPTPVPDKVRAAGARQMINHRGGNFHDLLRDVTERLKPFYGTTHDVLTFAASGTGGLEAALANCFSPGDRVLSLICGHFGERFADIATAYGLEVTRMRFSPGQAVDADRARRVMLRNPAFKGILLTHNETATGVQNPVEAIGEVAREFNCLLLLDSISALGAVPLEADAWGVDVVVTASQKAWMTPPGLTMISVGPRAWDAYRTARLPRYYFDFGAARKYLDHWETPATPAVSLLFQLQAALQLMGEEGQAAIYKRHLMLRNYVRERVRALGLELLAADEIASCTVTAVALADARQVIADMRRHGVELSGGQGPLEGRLVRIGHLGWVSRDDMAEVLNLLGDLTAR